MFEPDCCDLPDLVKTATPLPWTTGGPNDHSKPQQTASISPTVSVADPTYYYKNRVIDMKQLEVIKKRLSRGIDVRINSKNILSFRVRFRKKGYPDQIKTFPNEKLAKQWLAENMSYPTPYEVKIKNMGNAGRNGGEYYIPRPLIRAIIPNDTKSMLRLILVVMH